MQVKSVDVTLYEKGKTKGFVKITLEEDGEELLVLKDWVLIQGSKGLFAVSPSKKYNDEWYNQTLVFGKLREQINDAVISAYNRALSGSGGAPTSNPNASAGRANSRVSSAPF